jgi:hypothetical protein
MDESELVRELTRYIKAYHSFRAIGPHRGLFLITRNYERYTSNGFSDSLQQSLRAADMGDISFLTIVDSSDSDYLSRISSNSLGGIVSVNLDTFSSP